MSGDRLRGQISKVSSLPDLLCEMDVEREKERERVCVCVRERRACVYVYMNTMWNGEVEWRCTVSDTM